MLVAGPAAQSVWWVAGHVRELVPPWWAHECRVPWRATQWAWWVAVAAEEGAGRSSLQTTTAQCCEAPSPPAQMVSVCHWRL